MAESFGALDGIRVIETASGWAGPMLGRLLAELGADVVKVERPDGDWLRRISSGEVRANAAFHAVNAQKQSVVLDLSGAEDRHTLDDLLGLADVVIDDGTLAKPPLPLDHVGLSKQYSQLIVCAVTPFGLTGPLAGQSGSDLTVQAMSGLMSVTGFPDGEPRRAGPLFAEHAAAIYGCQAVLAALLARSRLGIGQVVDISLLEATLGFMGVPSTDYFAHGTTPPRLGNSHAILVPASAYPARDGWISMFLSDNKKWAPLLQLIGRPDLAADPAYQTVDLRRERRDEIDGFMAEWARATSVREATEALHRIGIDAAAIVDLPQIFQDEQVAARGLIARLGGTDGTSVTSVGPLFKMSVTPGRIDRAAPDLGAEDAPSVVATWHGQSSRRPAPQTGSGSRSTGPLAGLRVLQLGTGTAGPFAARTLADLGAHVIKIEPIRGDRSRTRGVRLGTMPYFWHHTYAGVRSVALDIQHPAGRSLLDALVRQVDALVESFAPGKMVTWGLGYEQLKEINPRLLYCSISGYGQTGPRREEGAHDNIVQAAGGIMSITGEPDNTPIRVGASASDMITATFGAAGILAGLIARERTGVGQHIDVAMLDGSVWLTQVAWPLYLARGEAPRRRGNRHFLIAPQNTYTTRDGLVALTAETAQQWTALALLIGLDPADHQYATPDDRLANEDALDQAIAAWTLSQSTEVAVAACRDAGVPCGPVLDFGQAISQPQVQARGFVEQTVAADGTNVPIMGYPAHFCLTLTRPSAPGPELGEHTEMVLGDLLGLDPAAIQRLVEQGVAAVFRRIFRTAPEGTIR